MRALREFKCDECRSITEAFADHTDYGVWCHACGAMARRVYSVPVTDCYSFGRNGYAARTPDYARKSYHEEDERRRHQTKRELGITSKLVPKG